MRRSLILLLAGVAVSAGELFDFEADIDWRQAFPAVTPDAVFKYEEANAKEGLDLALERLGAPVVGICRADRPYQELECLDYRILPLCSSVLHQWNRQFTGPYATWLEGQLAGDWRVLVAGVSINGMLPLPAQAAAVRGIRAGRGWLWIGGGTKTVELLERSVGPFLPEPRERVAGAATCRLTEAGAAHPLTAGFAAARLDGPLPRLLATPAPDAVVLLTADDTPLLVVRAAGRGRVVGIAWDGAERGGWLWPLGFTDDRAAAARELVHRAIRWAGPDVGSDLRAATPALPEIPGGFRIYVRRPWWVGENVPAGEPVVEQAWNGEVTWHPEKLAPVVEVPASVWSPWAWQVLPYWAFLAGAEGIVLPASPGLRRPAGDDGEAGRRWLRATAPLRKLARDWRDAEPPERVGEVYRRRLGDRILLGAVNPPELFRRNEPLVVPLPREMNVHDALTGEYLGRTAQAVLALDRRPVAIVIATPP